MQEKLNPLQAYLYDGYWEDIGTIEAFYESNLALTDDPHPKFRWAFLWKLMFCKKARVVGDTQQRCLFPPGQDIA